MKENIEDLKLEIELLQKKDESNALKEGVNNKYKWLKEKLESENDEIAKAIIDISNRYQVPVMNIAALFDETMTLRVKKEITKTQESKKIA